MHAGFQASEPSVAAVTGSMDPNLATYAAEVQLQPHRLEIIQVMQLQVIWTIDNICPV